MPRIEYRPARPEDLPEMADVFIETLADLYARTNQPSRPQNRAWVLALYEHVLSTGVFHLVKVDGRVAAIAGAILRDRLWFLSAFWCLPQYQRQHIGMPLLRGVWGAGAQAGAQTFFTWASIDLTAMASYMKLGLLPGYQILFFGGTPIALDVPPEYRLAPLDQAFAQALDRKTLGSARPMDHAFWARTGVQGWQAQRDEEAAGYFYTVAGRVGPLAWSDPRHAAALLGLACRQALETAAAPAPGMSNTPAPAATNAHTPEMANARTPETASILASEAVNVPAPEIYLPVPGINHAALRFALDAGLRLTGFSHLLASAPFGHLESYIPSGPGLF